MKRAGLRTTFTYQRADVAREVRRLAESRGCDPQDVINAILGDVLLGGRVEQLERQVEALQLAITLLGRPGAGAALAPASASVAVPRVRVQDTDKRPEGRRNPWDDQ